MLVESPPLLLFAGVVPEPLAPELLQDMELTVQDMELAVQDMELTVQDMELTFQDMEVAIQDIRTQKAVCFRVDE